MILRMRKSDFLVCEQKRHIPACTSVQSDQSLCHSLSGKYNMGLDTRKTCLRSF